MAVMENICRVWLLLSLFGFSLVSLKGGGRGKSSSSSSRSSSSSSSRSSFSSSSSSSSSGSAGSGPSDSTPQESGCELVTTNWHPILVTGYYGSSVVLPCHCTDLQAKPGIINWQRQDLSPVYNITEGDMEPGIYEAYKGRVALVDDRSPGDLSLIINNLREEDAGTYRCRTERRNEPADLIVEGCDLAKSGERMEINQFSGESVLLPCWCSEEKAKPKTFTWKDPNGRLIRSYTEQSGRLAPRTEMFNEATIWNVSLLLSDLMVEDEGEYTCEINGTDNKVIVSLTITGCTLSDQGEVVEVEAQPGSSVLLPCACTNQETKPKSFRWTAPNGREIHWHYRGRAQLFHLTSAPGNLSLLLSDLTPEDQGVYRCEVAEGKSKVFVLTINVAGATHAKLTSDEPEVAVLESQCRLQHLVMFMLAALILLLITHITVGAMIIRWRNQGAAQSPCVHYSN